jgi:uncharacterized membrane protein YhaH (DUF805 family)
MSVASYLFSPRGRFRRMDFHFVCISAALVSAAVNFALLPAIAEETFKLYNKAKTAEVAKKTLSAGDAFGSFVETYTSMPFIISYISIILCWYISMIAAAKRFHDLEKSGWNSFHIFFPVHFWIMAFIGAIAFVKLGQAIAIVCGIFALYLYIQLALVPGSPNDTSFGPSPHHDGFGPSKRTVIGTLAALFIVTALIGFSSYKKAETYENFALVENGAKTETAATTTPDQKEAPNLDKAAAEKGDAEAQYKIAFAHATGANGGEKNPAEALRWLERAANQGHLAAQYNLGIFYTTGQYDTPVDSGKGYFWLTRASLGGYSSQDTVDFRALAAKKLTPETLKEIDARAQAWEAKPEAAQTP